MAEEAEGYHGFLSVTGGFCCILKAVLVEEGNLRSGKEWCQACVTIQKKGQNGCETRLGQIRGQEISREFRQGAWEKRNTSQPPGHTLENPGWKTRNSEYQGVMGISLCHFLILCHSVR